MMVWSFNYDEVGGTIASALFKHCHFKKNCFE